MLETQRNKHGSLRIRKSHHHSTGPNYTINPWIVSQRRQRQRHVQDVQNVAKFTRPSLKIVQRYVPCLYIVLTCTSRGEIAVRHFDYDILAILAIRGVPCLTDHRHRR